MSKVEGKDLEFWWDDEEQPVVEADLSAAFDTLDSTDSATPGDGKDTEVGRAGRSFTITQNLYTPDGAEMNSGTLTKGNRYRVTAKDTVLAAYDIGQIFEAAGTEVMSATDKVVPLGTKITGKTMGINIASADIPVTKIDYTVNYNQLDGTDTETTGDGKETILSRADRDTNIDAIIRDDEDDLLTTDPEKVAATLTFDTNNKVEGNILPISKNISDNVNDFSKISYAFKWVGAPTETNVGLATATEKAFKVRLKRGSSAHKEYTGNAIISQKNISCDISGLAQVKYTVQINGALTEAKAA